MVSVAFSSPSVLSGFTVAAGYFHTPAASLGSFYQSLACADNIPHQPYSVMDTKQVKAFFGYRIKFRYIVQILFKCI